MSWSSCSLSRCAWVCRERGPEVQRRVRAKRAPRASALAESRGARRNAGGLERAAEAEVAGGERVRLAESAKRDVLRRPRPDTGERAEARLEIFQAARGRELDSARMHGRGERPDR